MSLNLDTTLGALLLGGFCAIALSGVVVVQTFLYIRLFPQDSARVKAIVGVVFALDTTHSILLIASIWIYLVTNYGNEAEIGTIPIPLALTGVITANLTFIAICFFTHRIHRLNRQEWRITALILVLGFISLCCGIVSSAELIHLKTFAAFKGKLAWLPSLGLALSTLVDILITWFLIRGLHALRKEMVASRSMDRVISTVILYTFETNLLTSTAMTLSIICWLAMPHTMIFMGVYFFVEKLYANSLLATLNARQPLQQQRQRDTPVDLPSGLARPSTTRHATTLKFLSHDKTAPTKLEIAVAKSIEFEADSSSSSERAKHVMTV